MLSQGYAVGKVSSGERKGKPSCRQLPRSYRESSPPYSQDPGGTNHQGQFQIITEQDPSNKVARECVAEAEACAEQMWEFPGQSKFAPGAWP